MSKRKLTHNEAGMLGHLASLNTIAKSKQKRINDYYINPKLCKNCNTAIPYESKINTFCNKSCSAIYNNKLYPKRTKQILDNLQLFIGDKLDKQLKQCATCNSQTYNKMFCSLKCSSDFTWLTTKNKIESTNISAHPFTTRKYLFETRGYQCEQCHLTTWNNQPIPLVVDHINGNSEDNNLTNLRLLCCNCDAQTSTYKGRNKGNGRHSRRQRYKDGKSF